MTDFATLASRVYPSLASAQQPTTQTAPAAAVVSATPVAESAPAPVVERSIADRLYGVKPAAAAAEPEQQAEQQPEKTLAERMYPEPEQPAAIELPEAIKALRDDTARKMFGADKTHSTAVIADDLVNAQGIPPEQKGAVVTELRNMMADAGLSPLEGREIVSIAHQLNAERPTPQVEAQWQAAAMKQLTEQHGGKAGAEAALRAAQALVARDPRVAALLNESRLGNHPRVVELLVSRARAAKMRGEI